MKTFRCLQCRSKRPIEQKVRWWLPYCKGCALAFREVMHETSSELNNMTPAQRARLRKKLVRKGHTEEEIDEAWAEMGVDADD